MNTYYTKIHDDALIKIEEANDLLNYVEELSRKENVRHIYLRGQSKVDWELIPNVGRKQVFAGRERMFDKKIEHKILHRFRRHAYAQYNRVISEWEALFLGRHHGLPVRLLDWTPNPLVALFFACRSNPTNDGAVWAFIIRSPSIEGSSIDVFTETKPLEIKGVKIIYPFDASPRMSVQSSIFTIQDDPQKKLESYNPEDYIDSPGDFDIKRLIKWKVPAAKKTNLLDFLDRNSINNRSLFPDLDGIAKGIWEAEVLRYGKPKSP